MTPHRDVALALSLLVSIPALAATAQPAAGRDPVVFATWAGDAVAARKVEVLVDSLRRFGGRFKDAPVIVVADGAAAAALAASPPPGVRILPLAAPAVAAGFPYAEKAYAAAQVEALVESTAATLVWMDAGTLVLGEPGALDLSAGGSVALRPVSLVNRVGVAPDAPVDAFWAAIYHEAGVEAEAVPAVTPVVELTPVRFYVNCEVIAFRPRAGICREWARALTARIGDAAFLASACGDPLHRIFLHQAVLSAVILARTTPEERRWLPSDHGYSLLLHERLPAERRARRLDDLACAIYDTLWERRPDWLATIGAGEELSAWARNATRSVVDAARLAAAPPPPAAAPPPPPPPPPPAVEIAPIDTPREEAMVDVGGRRLHCFRYGKGAPTVVLVSGFGAPQRYWNPIVPALAEVATVVTYDRPGYGKSELGEAPNHGVQAADDLARLLDALGVPRPYVVVGHSYGGRIARLFASRHPEAVAAILLEESGHEDTLEAQIAALDGADRERIEAMAAPFLQRPASPSSERDYRLETVDQLHAAAPLPRLPFVVLAATDGSGLPQELSPAARERLRQINVEMQRRLAASVPGGRLIELLGVGHTIHVEKPELVLEPLLALVGGVKHGTP